MFSRGWFRVSYFSLSLIISCHPAFAGDGGVVSLSKSMASWATTAIKGVLTVAAATAANHYSNEGFGSDTGAFSMPQPLSSTNSYSPAQMTQGLPPSMRDIHSSPSVSSSAPTESRTERERLNHEYKEYLGTLENNAKQKAETLSVREINKILDTKSEKLLEEIKNNHAHLDTPTAREYAVYHDERKKRLPHTTRPVWMNEGELENYKQDLEHKLQQAQKEYRKAAAPDWMGRRGEARDEERQVKTLTTMIERVKTEQKTRINAKVTTAVATAMVLTQQNAGTTPTTTTKTEKTPSSGGGSGGNDQDPDKDPKKGGSGLIGSIAGPALVHEVSKSNKPHNETYTPAHSIDHHTPTPDSHTSKAERARTDYSEHQKAELEKNRQLIEQKKKDNPFKDPNQAPDPVLHQPPHITQKDLDFNVKPSKHTHIFRDEAAHVSQDTPEARRIFNECVKNPANYIGQDQAGNFLYKGTNPKDGRQIYVKVRDGKPENAGSSSVHWTNEQYLDPKSPKPKDRGDSVKYSIGIGGAIGTAATSQKASANSNELIGLSQATIDRIKTDSNPFVLPPAPKEHTPNRDLLPEPMGHSYRESRSTSPEMQAIINKYTDKIIKSTPSPAPSTIQPSSERASLPVSFKTPTMTTPLSSYVENAMKSSGHTTASYYAASKAAQSSSSMRSSSSSSSRPPVPCAGPSGAPSSEFKKH